MKCDLCDNQAIVHEVTVKNGVKLETHLCQECALAEGIDLPDNNEFHQFIAQFTTDQPDDTDSPVIQTMSRTCETCGLEYRSFRRHGVLGCPDCYTTFAHPLRSIIERAHGGAQEHVGKTPPRPGMGLTRKNRIARLIRDLDAAIASEEYERAASIRDEVKELDTDTPGTD